MYKIAIAGASSLLGRELKDALTESPLAAANFALLDEEDTQGQLDQVGDEATFIQVIGADAFDRADFTFFCGSEDLTRLLAAGPALRLLGLRLVWRVGSGIGRPGARSLAERGRGNRGFVHPGSGSGASGGRGDGAAARAGS